MNQRISTLILLLTLYSPHIHSHISSDTSGTRPTIQAIRVTNPIEVDGLLTELEWQQPGATEFTQFEPDEGKPPTEKTEVWVAYDDAALYVAARLYDAHPESIVTRIGRRDANLNADAFYVGLDSYHDRRTGFFFLVHAGGSVTDGTIFNDSWDDNSWDGVWDAATRIDEKGWTVEMRIPYSQLRFPEREEYTWGINFVRSIERRKERSDFVMVPKKESGWVSRFADLTGLRNINPPRRLEVHPYLVSRNSMTNQFDPADPLNRSTKISGDVGADMKIGLGSNLTLNATINPDFGQVEVDPSVVNLTQFEISFDEKRPFFIEGANFFSFGYGGANNNYGFNWGNPDFFYSRRIGLHPLGSVQHEGFVDYPDATRILAAVKLTGKVSDGWSLGTMHAMTAREYAIVDDGAGNRHRDVVEPLTSYNVVRSQREFQNGRQGLGLIGTAVIRDLNQSYLVDQFNRESFAFGLDGWTNIDNDQMYVLTGWLAATRVQGTTGRLSSLQKNPYHYFQRPDVLAMSFDPARTSLSGYAGRVALNKQKGNIGLNWALGIISPGFDSNDLGFMFRTDLINSHIVLRYAWYEPDGVFRRKSVEVATFRNYTLGENGSLLGGLKVGEGYFTFWSAQLMNYWNFNGSFSYIPSTWDNRMTRGGPLMKTNTSYNGYIFGRTDSRRAIVYGLSISGSRGEAGGHRFSLFPSIDLKPSSNVNVRISPGFSRNVNVAQYVKKHVDEHATSTYGTRYIFSRLTQNELSSTLRLDWIFTPKLSLQLFAQPLVSVGHYDSFKELKRPGTFEFNTYGEGESEITTGRDQITVDPDGSGGPAERFSFSNPDFNFKFLKVNAVLRWEYFPGSTAYLVWTRSGSNFDNPGDSRIGRDLADLLTAPDHHDVILLKLSYWWSL